jgi:hypothetical protein
MLVFPFGQAQVHLEKHSFIPLAQAQEHIKQHHSIIMGKS